MNTKTNCIPKLLLTFILTCGLFVMPINAYEIIPYSSDYLNSYAAYLTAPGNGEINVGVFVTGVDTMDKIGADTIRIYESTDSGRTWNWDGTYFSFDYPEMLGSGDYYNEVPITHPGTPGNQYYAVVTVYAGDHTGHDTGKYTTNPIIAR